MDVRERYSGPSKTAYTGSIPVVAGGAQSSPGLILVRQAEMLMPPSCPPRRWRRLDERAAEMVQVDELDPDLLNGTGAHQAARAARTLVEPKKRLSASEWPLFGARRISASRPPR